MAVDEDLHGLAQRYYLKALELAGAATDHLTYCTTLRGMSVQAVDLGHGQTAMRLGRGGVAAGSGHDSSPLSGYSRDQNAPERISAERVGLGRA